MATVSQMPDVTCDEMSFACPQIFLDCLNIIEFLGWECGNILFHDEVINRRGKETLSIAKDTLKGLV